MRRMLQELHLYRVVRWIEPSHKLGDGQGHTLLRLFFSALVALCDVVGSGEGAASWAAAPRAARILTYAVFLTSGPPEWSIFARLWLILEAIDRDEFS